MTNENGQQERAGFKSGLGFVLAAAGSAVGLGNIWKFPYITGENGGGLFVLIYLVCIVLVGIPIMVAEIMIGRAAQKQPVAAFHALQGKRTPWAGVGWLGVITGFVILSYYIVVAGWAMDYTLKSVVNFTKPIHEDAETEATKYLASTSIEQQRLMLAERRAQRLTKAQRAQIAAKVKPSVWKAHARFALAIDAAEDKETARQQLFLDEALKTNVLRAETLVQEQAAVLEQAITASQQYYSEVSDKDILAEAEDVKRREITFERVNAAFGSLATDGWTTTFWAALFMAITIMIVARGISGGIERACQILMPGLFVLILVMVVYGATKSGFAEAISFVFKPDPSKLKPSGILEALGHAFFTLSLGMGAMITYGSYQKSKQGLVSQSITIATLDTVIALMACLMMFPIIFSYGQEPSGGPGLVFKSMPLAFSEIGQGGMLLAIIFFALLVFAALTSAISLLEVVASYFIDEHNWSRTRAAIVLGLAVLVFSLPTAFSDDPDASMSGWTSSFGMNFFDAMDILSSNWMLPLGGLLISIYAGWVMPRELQKVEMSGVSTALFTGWLILVRFVAPALVIIVLLQKVGILDADELFHGLF